MPKPRSRARKGVEGMCLPSRSGNRLAAATNRLVAGIADSAVYASAVPSYESSVAKYQDLIAPEDGLLAMNGTTWVLADSVSSDQILAPELLRGDASRLRGYLFAGLGVSIAGAIRRGDFLVAGRDFAFDATHRTIPLALKEAGIAAILARSFGRFFLRHALHVGLPALVVEETGAIKQGDFLRVDIEAHTVANRNSGDRYVIRNSDEETLRLLRAGGSGQGRVSE